MPVAQPDGVMVVRSRRRMPARRRPRRGLDHRIAREMVISAVGHPSGAEGCRRRGRDRARSQNRH
jgi:hypothetical protein